MILVSVRLSVRVSDPVAVLLVPIRVGMILSDCIKVLETLSCPHTRGDDPCMFAVKIFKPNLSPYAWG